MLYELLRGLAYQRIRHDRMHWWKLTVPALLTIGVSAVFLFLPVPPTLLTKDGLFAASLSVISTLPGFYFAGLAAVATFQGLNMDAVIQAPAPEITVKVAGASVNVTLSRRQFLSYLFSYLVILSFVLCAITLALLASTNSIYAWHAHLKVIGSEAAWPWIRGSAIVGYVGLASSLVVTSLHGMFFLTERIHQP
jgi:hypothetical protein